MTASPGEAQPQFAVIIRGGRDGADVAAVLGPFTDRAEADAFAEFATAEIDPAEVRTLCSPVTELLNWRRVIQELNSA